jgi:hypothetical protein
MKNKVFDRLEDWWMNITSWDWNEILFILLIIAMATGFILLCLWAGGYFYDEVENYDFTAQVYDKEHYTTQSVSYISNGKTRTPVIHTYHHYKVMWEDGGERGVLEVGSNHYDLIKIGDFINVHCSVRADKQGELHYYYSFKGY